MWQQSHHTICCYIFIAYTREKCNYNSKCWSGRRIRNSFRDDHHTILKEKTKWGQTKNIMTINYIANSPVLQSPTVACLKLEYKNKRASLSGLLFSFFTSSAAFVNSWNRNMHYVDLYTMSTCSSPSFSHLKIKETFQAWASTFLSAILFLPTFKKF